MDLDSRKLLFLGGKEGRQIRPYLFDVMHLIGVALESRLFADFNCAIVVFHVVLMSIYCLQQ